MKVTIIFLLLILITSLTESYKILVLCVHPGKSHFRTFEPLFKGLADKGHEVTVISYFPQEREHPKYNDISPKSKVFTSTEEIDMRMFDGSWQKTLLSMFILKQWSKTACEEFFSHDDVRKLINSNNQKFDIIIYELFVSDCLLGFAHKFQAPLLALSTPGLIMPWAYQRFGNPNNPSYILNQFFNHYGEITFFKRMYNTFLDVFSRAVFELGVMPTDNEFIQKEFGKNYPHVKDIYMNTSMLLMNSHFSISEPIPKVPAIVEVGGLHVLKSTKLPENLEKWINESKHGVIYFSMGSLIKGTTFPEEKRKMFLRVFKRLPQRVLWKYESDNMPGKPDNVMIQRWMPQYDILCHPNVKAFVSHGGMLGTTETVQCGVPVLVMPQFGDQFTNAKAIEASGGGIIFDFWKGDEETLYNSLIELLQPGFQKQAQQLSARFRDRPLPPLETAIYWVEYVARHGGAHHMRTAAVDMPLYKYLLLDVIFFLVAVLLSFLWITYTLCKFVVGKIVRRPTKIKTS